MLPHGAHEINHHLHVPAPGRVQYYRAECLPFVPHEVKCQLRFPKAYAQSEQNLRYLDRVRAETAAFLKENVKVNYFDGSDEIPLTTSLGEAEVLFAASDKIKAMADNGELQQIHEKVANLKELSETQYINLKDRLMNIINAGHAKEDEIFDTLIEDHEVTGIRKHHVFGDSVLDMMSFTYKMASVENLSILANAIEKAEDPYALEQCQVKLVALLGSKVNALEQLVLLQDAYLTYVENDSANEKLLQDLKMDHQRCLGTFSLFENP